MLCYHPKTKENLANEGLLGSRMKIHLVTPLSRVRPPFEVKVGGFSSTSRSWQRTGAAQGNANGPLALA